MVRYLVILLLAAVLTYAFSDVSVTLQYGAFEQTLSALLNISSIIFAIIGAWIAIIYPKAIGKAFIGHSIGDEAFGQADTDANYLSELVEIVLVSALVLMIVLSIQFLAPLAREIITPKLLPCVKGAFFFLITFLTLSQLNAVFRVIVANYFFLNELRRKNVQARIDAMHD